MSATAKQRFTRSLSTTASHRRNNLEIRQIEQVRFSYFSTDHRRACSIQKCLLMWRAILFAVCFRQRCNNSEINRTTWKEKGILQRDNLLSGLSAFSWWAVLPV